MIIENKDNYGKNSNLVESFTVRITNPMLYDRLHILSVEYSLPVEVLVNAALKRLVEDVDFVRSLRTGRIGSE